MKAFRRAAGRLSRFLCHRVLGGHRFTPAVVEPFMKPYNRDLRISWVQTRCQSHCGGIVGAAAIVTRDDERLAASREALERMFRDELRLAAAALERHAPGCGAVAATEAFIVANHGVLSGQPRC